jgi:acyl-CoA thioesterase FadM
MNLWLRVLWLFLSAPFGARIAPPFGVSRLRFRVWPLDLDTNLHMNNGRYLTIADLGRADLLLRTGLWRAVLKEGLLPMLSGSAIRYRRELRPFEAFVLESRIIAWTGTSFVMEHRFLARGRRGATGAGEDVTAAIALVRGGLYHKRERRFLPAQHIADLSGYDGPAPEITPDIAEFLALEAALKSR